MRDAGDDEKTTARRVQDLFRLDGRIVLLTGGAGRFGRVIAEAVAEAGAMVIVTSREAGRCGGVAEGLRGRGWKAASLTLDLSEEASIRSVWREIEERWGHVDILFNNAVARSGSHFDRMTAEDWERTLAVNARGLFVITKLVAHNMAARRYGSIVNVASIHGVVAPDFKIYGSTGMSSPANYAFEKGGIIQLTRYLAVLFAPHGIRVNALSPGGYFSPDLPEEFVRNYCLRTPLGRMAGPDDIKGAALFLASDASAYVTGQNLLLDGGYTAL